MKFAETHECKRGHISRSSFMFNRRCEKEKGNIVFAYVYAVLMKLFSNIYQFSVVPVVTAFTFVYFVNFLY